MCFVFSLTQPLVSCHISLIFTKSIQIPSTRYPTCSHNSIFSDNNVNYPRRVIQRYINLMNQNKRLCDFDLSSTMKACSKIPSVELGKQIHAQSFKHNLSSNVFVQTSIISMYLLCDQLNLALDVFDRMPDRNVVSWTSLMDASLRLNRTTMALKIFKGMCKSGIKLDCHAVVSVLSLATQLGALNLGKWVHSYIEKCDLYPNAFVGTALVDMYCKCGMVENGISTFRSLPRKNTCTWNAMLSGMAAHGFGYETLRLFLEMEEENETSPNSVTFIAVLSGCTHSGLVEEGRYFFNLMKNKYKIDPNIKHYGCMVDLLGRAGLLKEAFEVIVNMPILPNKIVWGSLLSACRIHKNIVMAERVMDRINETGGDRHYEDTSHFVIMSNMYAETGSTEKMSAMRMHVGRKPAGQSWIEINSEIHEFGANENSNPSMIENKKKLEEMMKKIGKEHGESLHSEKIALAFGLLKVKSPVRIRITKNLRMCEDCHNVMKLISKAYEREIAVRDCTRYHLFSGGWCSCGDYW